jgi:P2-related tail formation protein
MIKGTPAVVQEMVSTVLSDGVVTEWFQYGGEAYHFRVQTDEIISSEDIYNRLSAVITATQNIRSWLDCVLILRNWSGTDYIGGIICEGKTLTIGPVQFQSVGASGEAYTGGIIYEYKNYTVFGALPSVSAAFCIMPILL